MLVGNALLVGPSIDAPTIARRQRPLSFTTSVGNPLPKHAPFAMILFRPDLLNIKRWRLGAQGHFGSVSHRQDSVIV